jgi:hypothetical protein
MQATVNPIQMLKEDHKKVQELFKKFEDTEDVREKKEIAMQAIRELKVHAAIEEEIFYPNMREHAEEKEDRKILNEALEEHHVVHLLIDELETMDSDDEQFEAKFMVLAENVKHHIKEEESEMLPQAEETEEESELEKLGEEMSERKLELIENEQTDEMESPRNASKQKKSSRGKASKKSKSSSRKSTNGKRKSKSR